MNAFVAIAAISYLLGSVPFGYILVRVVRGEDVRRTGSGNIGATNVSRTSPALGVATLALDTLKGLFAVALARYLFGPGETAAAVAALFAVAGHIFPVWLGFRGGKGVATGLGAFLLVAPKSVLVAGAVFVMLVAVFRYVSLGSIVAAASFPISSWVLDGLRGETAVLVICASALIVIKHHENIRRLASGTENRWGPR
jgi:acyl phosphate:glycerol-3-phosphate acyltransferase